MKKFDRVFQGQDVNFLRLIQLVQHRGKRRCLSAAGGARHEDDPVLLLDHLVENRRQPEAFQRGDFCLQLPHHDGLPAVLLENVHAQTRDIAERVTAIA